MAKTKFGTFDDVVAGLPREMEAIARAARKQIFEIHPNALEVVRLGYRAATYGFGPKMNEAHTHLSPQMAHVNLGFSFATALPDPRHLLEGTGKNMRHVKLRSVADVTRTRELVVAAVAERGKALGVPYGLTLK